MPDIYSIPDPTPTQIVKSEIWLPVPGYEALYQVSDTGKVRVAKTRRGSRHVGYELKLGHDSHGYSVVWLWKDGCRSRRKVHHLVALTFIGARPERFEINHRDGIRDNNHVDNLEWVSRSDNAFHAYRVLGRKGATPKVTAEQVAEIRQLYKAGGITMRALGDIYGIAVPTVHNLIHGVTWKNAVRVQS